MDHLVQQQGLSDLFDIDSAGTGGWHVGENCDPRTARVLREHGIAQPTRARQLSRQDFVDFDYLIAMDRSHEKHLFNMGAPTDKVSLFLDWDPLTKGEEVEDPYYGSERGFVEMYAVIEAGCSAMLCALQTAD